MIFNTFMCTLWQKCAKIFKIKKYRNHFSKFKLLERQIFEINFQFLVKVQFLFGIIHPFIGLVCDGLHHDHFKFVKE